MDHEVYDHHYNSSELQADTALQATIPSRTRGCLIVILVITLLLSLIPFFIVYDAFSNGNVQMTGKNCTIPVTATVCRLESEQVTNRSSHGGYHTFTSYSPVYAFEYNGVPYEVESFFGNSTPKYAVGAQVTLLINPDNPTEVYNKEDQSSLHMAYLMTMAFPAGVIFVVLILVFKYKNAMKRAGNY